LTAADDPASVVSRYRRGASPTVRFKRAQLAVDLALGGEGNVSPKGVTAGETALLAKRGGEMGQQEQGDRPAFDGAGWWEAWFATDTDKPSVTGIRARSAKEATTRALRFLAIRLSDVPVFYVCPAGEGPPPALAQLQKVIRR
jgi:hypothetical protein